MTDYPKLAAQHKKQKAALTRAVNRKDKEAVLTACRNAVAEWDAPDAYWPDDWSRWQRALSDICGFGFNLDDLT